MHPATRPPTPARRPGPRTGVGAALALVTLAVAGCGGSHAASSPAHPSAPASGKAIFSDAGCSSCHTLAAAGATGNVGPDLDNLKPSYAAVVHQVTDGGGGMPSFRGQLSTAEIERVARFVASATH